MTTESFNGYYVLGTNTTLLAGPDSPTYGPFISTLSSLTDDQDGDTTDGQTDGGDPLSWSLSGATTRFFGFTGAGDPVIAVFDTLSSEFVYYALSDDNSLSFTTHGTTSGGTYGYCFAAGTRIATPDGALAVEALRIGDEVATADGRPVPVKWIGRQTIDTRWRRDGPLRLVRLPAGVLGDGLPHRDLRLTADHALLLDGLLVNAGALVDGIHVTWDRDAPGRVTVYHVETEDHDLILAEGTPAETFIDYATRRDFDNYTEYLALYGEDRTVREMGYPRVTAARLLPSSIRDRLGATQAA